MADIRKIAFEIDPATWEQTQVPPPLVSAAAAGEISLDLDAALLSLGPLTRPPEIHGFTLSDTWAWLRHYPAFGPGPRLRLRPEWTRVDPHQKTVASDDYGVGLGTWVLRDLLGFERYADALYVVNVLERGQWIRKRHAKTGPSKSPDYVAYDKTGAISVVECKGTQSSRAELLRAMDRGIKQKRALTPLGSQQLIHQLVVGTYIPQHNGSRQALIAVHDPEKLDSRQELRRFTEDDIRRSVEQVSIAKELALFEFSETASALVYGRYSEISLDATVDRDLTRSREQGRVGAEEALVQRELRWATPIVRNGASYVGLRFTARIALDQLAWLTTRRASRDLPDSVLADSIGLVWERSPTDSGAILRSPHGVAYQIEWLDA